MAGIYGKLGALQQAMFPLGPCSLPPPFHPYKVWISPLVLPGNRVFI